MLRRVPEVQSALADSLPLAQWTRQGQVLGFIVWVLDKTSGHVFAGVVSPVLCSPQLVSAPHHEIQRDGTARLTLQMAKLRAGCDLMVATVGRLMNWWKRRKIYLDKIKWLVLDEADKMLGDSEFRRCAVGLKTLNPQVQVVLFSATFPTELDQVVRDFVANPYRLTIGELNESISLIKHQVMVCKRDNKLEKLTKLIRNQPVSVWTLRGALWACVVFCSYSKDGIFFQSDTMLTGCLFRQQRAWYWRYALLNAAQHTWLS